MCTPLQVWGATARSHQSWSTEEGLPNASVHQVFQSRDGYLWIATEGGVARFDGLSFRVLDHKTEPVFTSDDVSAIAQDASGSLWFGTADGLIEDQHTRLRRFDERDGLPSSTILSLASASDGLLVLTSRGLIRLQGERFIPAVPLSMNVLALEPAPNGEVWLLTSSGVWRYAGGTLRSGPVQATASTSVKSVRGVQTGPDGAIWLRSPEAVTAKLHGAQRTFRIAGDLPGTRTSALYVDRRGVAWIGTNRGLASFDLESDAVADVSQFLREESVLSIMEDREGNLWIGTEASGLHVLRRRKFRSEPAAAGEAVTAGTTASDGTVWYGTRREGLHSIGPGSVAYGAMEHGSANKPVADSALTSPVILSLASGAHGEVWAGTPDGLNRVTGNRVQQYTSSNGLPDDFVRSVLVDSRGAVWAGTRQGLVRIDAEKAGNKPTTYTEADGLGSDSIGPILEAPQASKSLPESKPYASVDLWIGTAAGLSHFRENRLESFSPHPGGSGNAVTALAHDGSGTLWVALHGEGLSRFAGGTFRAISSSALPSEIVSLVPDRKGFLWLRGTDGVFRASLAEISACADDSKKCKFAVARYGSAEGMPSDAVAAEGTPAMWQGPHNELWIATRKGIAVADPAHLPENLLPPPVVLQRLVVDDADIPLGAKEVQVDPGHRRYTFDYAALSYTLPSAVRYRYMLEGFDKEWVNAGSQRSASYTSLPPRRYRFRVQAENEDGVWNQTGAELRVQILPPIYRRWWFYALLLLIAGGVTWSLFRLRLRVVQRRFGLVLTERNRVAREIHDTLAQDFVSVSLQLDLAAHMLKANNQDGAATQLQATRKLVKEGLESARQSIWNLRADAAEDSLPARLTSLVKRHGDSEPPIRLKIGGAFRKLPAAMEENVLRIAQESLVNSLRHSAATDRSIQLHYESEALRLTVADNGRGFSLDEGRNKQGHYGLGGMEERAALLRAQLTITSSPGEGTSVTLVVPLGSKKEGAR